MRDSPRVLIVTPEITYLPEGMGNLWQRPLKEIVANYVPSAHPVIGPLLEGGPVALAERYDLPHEETYADACHMCYLTREALRARFPEFLAPDEMYGES